MFVYYFKGGLNTLTKLIKYVCTKCLLSCPGKRALGPHWIGDRVGPGAGMDMIALRKIFFPCRDLKPGPLASSLVTIMNEVFQLLTLFT